MLGKVSGNLTQRTLLKKPKHKWNYNKNFILNKEKDGEHRARFGRSNSIANTANSLKTDKSVEKKIGQSNVNFDVQTQVLQDLYMDNDIYSYSSGALLQDYDKFKILMKKKLKDGKS